MACQKKWTDDEFMLCHQPFGCGNKKGAENGAFWVEAGDCLLLVAVITLGRAVHLFVAVLAGGAVGCVFVDLDLGGLACVALGAIAQFLTVSLVIEGDVAFRGFVYHAVRSDCDADSGECDQHHHDNQFFHGSPPELKWVVLTVDTA
jgi:hypothetical protein